MFLLIVLSTLYGFLQLIKSFRNKRKHNVKCLIGKTAIITGGNSGIGYGTAMVLASRGCRVIIADCVNAEQSKDSIIETTGNPNISYKHLDLSSLKSIRQFCEDIGRSEKKIDILFNNAGIGASRTKITEDGLNFVMQVNYFGAFLLTHLLIKPLIAAKSGRVIFASSGLAFFHNLTPENLNKTDFEIDSSNIKLFYGNSKLCNMLAAKEIGRRLRKYGIAVNSNDPGAVSTGIVAKAIAINNDLIWRLIVPIVNLFFERTALDVGGDILHLCTCEDHETGGFYGFGHEAVLTPNILKDQQWCNQIWEQTEKLVQLKPEEML